MSDPAFSKRELYRLLGDLCNETLSRDDHGRLQEILKTHAAAREEYLAYLDLHYGLRTCLRVGDESMPGAAAARLLASVPCSVVAPTFRDQASLWRSAPAVGMALVAVFLLVAGVSIARNRHLSRDAVGVAHATQPEINNSAIQSLPPLDRAASEVVISQIASAKFFGESVPALGQPVRLSHEYAVTSGMIELRFPSGATTIIESPAVFEVTSLARLLLHTGRCSVHAPDGAQGFRVDTPLGNVVDLGTRFVVDVLSSGATDVHVIEGEADVFPHHEADAVEPEEVAPRRINLRGGQANRLSGDRDVVASDIPFRRRGYQAGLPDRVVKFDAVEDHAGAVDELLSVTVQRGGKKFTYGVDELIGIDLLHFQSGHIAAMVTPAAVVDTPLPERDTLPRSRYLDRGRSLCSGLINPGGQSTPLATDPIIADIDSPSDLGTPGLGFRFQTPLENSVGPDLVLFELQTIVNSERGDAFHVSPLKFAPGLRSFTVDSYDIDLVSPQSKFLQPYRLYRLPSAPTSLGKLLSMEHVGGPVHTVRAKVLAVAIDLSDLGYRLGDKVDGLFLQDADDDNETFDPVFIGGFPPVP